MISVAQALEYIGKLRPDCGSEVVPLKEACGRILDAGITASFSQPAAPTSVMDGYAFRKQDLGHMLTVVGEARAGQPYAGALSPNEAVRIFTGAHLPRRADSIEIQEYAIRESDSLQFSKLSKDRNYIRPLGSNFMKGDLLVDSGQAVTPAVISAIASANISSVSVKRKPRIAILRCGDELRSIGSALKGDKIIDSNGPFLTGLLSDWGFDVLDLGVVADDAIAIKNIIRQCEADIIVPVGGASVGDYDFTKDAFLQAGFKPVFDKVAVKPGKPVWLSHREGQIALGLPGNPNSVFVCSHMFLSHLLGRKTRWDARVLTDEISANDARERYILAKWDVDGRVTPIPKRTGSAVSMAQADLLIRRMPMADHLSAGDKVDCFCLS